MPDAPLFSDPALREAGAVRLREERDVGAVLSAALRLATSEARPLFTAVFAIVGPMILAAALVRVAGGRGLASAVDGAANLLATVTVLAFVRLYVRGAPLGVADVWDEAKPLLGPVFVFLVLIIIGLVALLIPVSLLVAATGGGAVTGAFAVVAVVALVLFGVPFVSLGLAAVGLDELRASEALARVRDLTRGRLGLVVGTFVVLILLAFFVLVVLGGTLGALFSSGFSAGDPGGGPATAIATAALTLVALPVSVVVSLVWTVLYGSLVESAEGTSLGEGLDNLARALDDRPIEAARPADAERPSGPARSPEAVHTPEAASDALGRLLDDGTAERPPPAAPGGGFRGGGFRGGDAPESRS